jgi:hypothetical protein
VFFEKDVTKFLNKLVPPGLEGTNFIVVKSSDLAAGEQCFNGGSSLSGSSLLAAFCVLLGLWIMI